MKLKHDDVTSSESCSCTSCTYKSASDRPSYRKIIAQGSRIDKLYMGKFIPLRERTLLGKLVRTRAVYEDLRTQLLSESNLSISENADLKPRAARGKEFDAETSSAILELVNLVDKGAALGPRRLSECCSCCSCGSTIPLQEHEGRIHRYGRAHISSRSSMVSTHRTKDEHRKGRQVRHKTKHISSDPCTCTSKLSGFIKRESKTLIKRLRGKKPSEQTFEPQFEFDEYSMISGRKLENYKVRQAGMGETIRNSLTKIKHSKTKVGSNVKAGTKKSLEALRSTKQKVKSALEESGRKTINKLRPDGQNEEIPRDEDNLLLNAIKDSLTKYREDNEKKELSTDLNCDFVCNPEKCEPEECFRIITRKKLRREFGKNNAGKTELYQKLTTKSSNRSDVSIQAENQDTAATTATKNQKINIDKKVITTGINTDNDIAETKREDTTMKYAKKKIAKVQEKNTGPTIPATKSAKSYTSIQPKGSKTFVKSTKKVYLVDEPSHTKERQAVRISSSLNFSIEFYKEKPVKQHTYNGRNKVHKEQETTNNRHRRIHKSSNTSQNIKQNAQNGLALRRCFCTLKLKPNKNKLNINKIRHYKSRSTPSLASKSVSARISKNLEAYSVVENANIKPNSPRPAVERINKIELYDEKNTRPHPNAANKNINSKQLKHLADKPSQITSSGKSTYTLVKYNLRRCLCTLKLAKRENKNGKQFYSKGMPMPGQSVPTTNESNQRVMNRVAERKNKLKQALQTQIRQSGTDEHKTKSTYNINRNRNTHTKSIIVQSISNRKLVPKKESVHWEIKSSPETQNKQGVRIGSSFSFNIEFYKGKSTPKPFNNVTKLSKHVSHKATKAMRSLKADEELAIKPLVTPSSMQPEKKKKQSNANRCFCPLKLHKMARNSRKNTLKTTGTETAAIKEEMYPSIERATRGTKMKKINHNILKQLKPYECEPNICVPGQCNPIQCLKRIKVRDRVTSKKFGTETKDLRRKLTSSATNTNKTGKNAANQSSQKAKKYKRYRYTPYTANSRASTDVLDKYRQIVRIGSNFSFNVDIYKDRFSNNYNSITTERIKSKLLLNKEDNNRVNSRKHDVLQSLEIKNHTKSSGFRPILKRCICTLEMQNNKKIISSVTAMPFQIKNRTFSTLCNEEMSRPRCIISKQSTKTGTYSRSFPSVFSSSYTESSHFTAYTDVKSYRGSKTNNFGLVISSKSMITKLKHQNTLNGVNKYLKSSYYAMNIHVQNKQKKRHKLKPYECEPGICIPGQCNPMECQKSIMKRLVKRASTMTYTEKRSRSSSNGKLHSKSKNHQYNNAQADYPKLENKEQGFKYKTLPRAHKQVVRVGSSFSFNIEFSKDRGTRQVFQDNKRKKMQGSSSNTNLKQSESTGDTQMLRQNRKSQSAVTMHHKGSYRAPEIKRCFCTLKIQKKGRQNNALKLKMNEKLETKHDIKTADSGQNTKKYKPYSLSDLDPDECEPNVCTPGECDPHQCLEKIKRKGRKRNTKNLGIDARPRKMTTSSMTSNKKKEKSSGGTKVSKGKEKSNKAPIEKKYTRPSRQVIGICSSFKFDVEFIKDKSFPNEDINTPLRLSTKPRDHNPTISQNVGRNRNINQTGIQDSKSIRHQDSQVELPAKHEKSTKTGSLIKRCFCTANLHREGEFSKVEIPKNPKASFLTKCYCVLKSLTAVKPKSKIPKSKALAKANSRSSSASTQTNKIKERSQVPNNNAIKLDPNECEPGVCVPGKCDPLICIERIRKRKAYVNNMASTEVSRTKSTASLSQPSIKSISIGSNAHTKDKSKKTPKISKTKKRSKSSDNSCVRIGSNFSFSMELFKENNPSFENIQKLKKQKVAATKSLNQNTSHKAKRLDNAVLLHSRESQIDHVKKENKSSDVGPMLKRCFCTLALLKQTKERKETKLKTQKDVKKKGIKIQHLKKSTKSPIKTMKNPVANKNQPTKSSITMKQTSKSITTAPRSRKKHKNPNFEALNRRKKTMPNKQSVSSKGLDRQDVKFGSNFSFNVEFAKSKADGVNNFKRTKHHNITNDATNQFASRVNKKHQNAQEKKHLHHAFSQVLAKKVKSTVTEVGPLLKRCFCTLTLKTEKLPSNDVNLIKSVAKTTNKNKIFKPTIPHVDKSIDTDTSKKYPTTLDTNECERGTCMPGKCNPHQCLKRIQQRLQSKMSNQVDTIIDTPKNTLTTLDPYECEPGTCIPGKCYPHQCLKRIQQRLQSKMSNTEARKARQISTTTSNHKHSSNKPTTTGSQMQQSKRDETGDNIRIENKRAFQSPTNSQKQVIRIGSNFSFNVEFFKENSLTNVLNSPTYPNEKLPKMPSQSHQTSHTFPRKQTKLYDRKLQVNAHKTQSRASGVGPLMKRCFCTLKLQKMGKLQQKEPAPVGKMKKKAVTANIKTKIEDSKILKNVGTETSKKHRALDPFECEPQTCIPGMCNPLECFERIKLRNLNDIGTDTLRPSKKYVGSSANGKTHLKKIQTAIQSTDATKPATEQKEKKTDRGLSTTDKQNHPSVCRYGSSFNFNIEFYKKDSGKTLANERHANPSISDNHQKARIQPIKTTSQTSQGLLAPYNHRAQQVKVAKENAGSGIAPHLKRCFCTLTLHKTETNKKDAASKVFTQNKETCTNKIKLQEVPNILDLNEREREIKTKTSSRPRPTQNKATCTKKNKSQKVSNVLDHNDGQEMKTKTSSRPRRYSKLSSTVRQPEDAKIPRFVEQPRFQIMDPKYRQHLKIGTNISFNFELYKENTVVCKDDEIINKKCMQKLNPEKKMSIAGKSLKNCLYNITKNRQNNRKKVTTVGCVDHLVTMSPFKPAQYYLIKRNQQICTDDIVETLDSKLYNRYLELELNKPSKVKQNNKLEFNDVKYDDNHGKKCIPEKRGKIKEKDINYSKNIKIILPYKPRKYNKNKSNTLFAQDGIAKGAEHYCCSYRTCQDKVEKEQVLNVRKSKSIRLAAKEDCIMLHQAINAGPKNILGIKLFSRRVNSHCINLTPNTNNNCWFVKSNPDGFEMSERLPLKSSKNPLKPSTSLKNTAITIPKEICFEQRRNCYSSLQSGEGNSIQIAQFSEKSLVCHFQGLITEGQPIVVKCPGLAKHRAVNQNTNETIFNKQNASKKNKESLHIPSDGHVGFLFQCAPTFSECKHKFISSLDPQLTNSKHIKTCYICKTKYAGQCKGTTGIAKYKQDKALGNTIKIAAKTDVAKKPLKKPCVCKSFNENVYIPKSIIFNSMIHKYQPKKTKRYRDHSVSDHGSSMRKKPWFAVCHSCACLYKPWLNMLKIWKHFTDIVFFLLSVVVWSPCILVVESCRAAKCFTCHS